LRQQHNYLESLATLEKMDPRYKGVQKDIASVKVLLQQQAEENYRIGVNFFRQRTDQKSHRKLGKDPESKPQPSKSQAGYRKSPPAAQ